MAAASPISRCTSSGQLDLGGAVGPRAQGPADVDPERLGLDVLPSEGAGLPAAGPQRRGDVQEQPPQRILLLGGDDDLLDLRGGGDELLGWPRLPRSSQLARVALHLAMIDRVLERLPEDGVQPAGVGRRQLTVEQAKEPRVERDLVRVQGSDPADITPDASLVVPARPRRQADPMVAVPVRHHVRHRQPSLQPGPAWILAVETLEERIGLILRGERPAESAAVLHPPDAILASVPFYVSGPRRCHSQ